jgi:hypothetical protein
VVFDSKWDALFVNFQGPFDIHVSQKVEAEIVGIGASLDEGAEFLRACHNRKLGQ